MKKNIIYSFLGILLLISINANAQFESINLNGYKLTDFKYKSLGTNLGAGSNNSYYNRSLFGYSNSNWNSLSSFGSLVYSSTTYNRKYYGTQSIKFIFSNGLGKSSNDYTNFSFKSSSSDYGFFLDVNSNNRFYLSKDFFFGTNLRTSQSPSHSYSKTEYPYGDTTTLANEYKTNNTVSFQFGKGRFENVTDARLAIYILDDLLKQGRLSHTPSEGEVFAFADFITKALNKRVIDSRIKRIKEYVAIDSFLVSNGLTTKTDGLYFGLIDDNWNYGRLQSWETGSEWHIGVSPSLNYQNQFGRATDYNGFASKSRNELSEYDLSFDAGYSTSWISGLKWQKGYGVNGSFNVFKYDTIGPHYDSNIQNHKSIIGDANYHISYLPNTRTSINGISGIRLIKYLSYNFNNRMQLSPYILVSCNNYFSEKLRLLIDAKVNYDYYKEYDPQATTNRLYYMFSITFQYSIF